MTYDEAYAEAERNAKNFPTVERDGRKCIIVNGAVYPYDWFLRSVARMRMDGDV